MKTERQRRQKALEWLAVVRQARIDDATAAAYAVGVEDLPAWAVENACKGIGYRERKEYEPAWPELGAIRSAALAAMRADAERRDSARLLAPPEEKPIDPERLANFRADVAALIERKRMPAVSDRRRAASGERDE